MNNFLHKILCAVCAVVVSSMAVSCSNDGEDPGFGSIYPIDGTWVNDQYHEVLILGNDGSYDSTNSSLPQYIQQRCGRYTFSPSTSILSVSIYAVSGQNSAYTSTYFVTYLSGTELHLRSDDGEYEYKYVRRK